MNNNKNSPLRAYIVAGHLGWLIISPLILFIWGGNWLVTRFGWYEWTRIIFVLLGIVVMIGGVAGYSINLLNTYHDMKEKPPKVDKDDYDY